MYYSDGREHFELVRVLLFFMTEYFNYDMVDIPRVTFTNQEMLDLSGLPELSDTYVEEVNDILNKNGFILVNVNGGWYVTEDFTDGAKSLPHALLENFYAASVDRHLNVIYPCNPAWSENRFAHYVCIWGKYVDEDESDEAA